MARPKEKTGILSTTFQEKCLRERKKLQSKLARQLHDDIARLFESAVHSDVQLNLSDRHCDAHQFILKTRVPHLWEKLQQEHQHTHLPRNEGKLVFELSPVTHSQLHESLSEVYTSDHPQTEIDLLLLINKNVLYTRDNAESSAFSSNGIPGHNDTFPKAAVDTHDTLSTGSDISLDVISVINGDISTTIFPEFTAANDHVCTISSAAEGTTNGDMRINISADHSDSRNATISADAAITMNCLSRKIESDKNLAKHLSENEESYSDIKSADMTETESGQGVCVDSDYQDNGHTPSLVDDGTTLHAALPLPYETCSKLGDDLLRGFLEDVDADCEICVSGQEFRTHKCILTARSSYFGAMLGGNWLESGTDKIHLEGISPVALKQALLFMYGGVVDILDTCRVAELILLADMYTLDGLKDIVWYHIKSKYCHFFHKPCVECISGVPDALYLSSHYFMLAMQDKCLNWVNKHMTKVWPTKNFALIPEESLDMCCNKAITDLTTDTVLDVIIDCDRMSTTLPHLKWAEPVLTRVTYLMDSAIEFTSVNFAVVISSSNFISLGQNKAWSMGLLDNILGTAIKSLPADNIVKSYLSLNKLRDQTRRKSCTWSEDFTEMIVSLCERCESHLKLLIHQVVYTPDWQLLSKDVQDEFMSAASYYMLGTNPVKAQMPFRLTGRKKAPVDRTKAEGTKRYSPQVTREPRRGSKKQIKTNKKGTVTSNSDSQPDRLPAGAPQSQSAIFVNKHKSASTGNLWQDQNVPQNVDLNGHNVEAEILDSNLSTSAPVYTSPGKIVFFRTEDSGPEVEPEIDSRLRLDCDTVSQRTDSYSPYSNVSRYVRTIMILPDDLAHSDYHGLHVSNVCDVCVTSQVPNSTSTSAVERAHPYGTAGHIVNGIGKLCLLEESRCNKELSDRLKNGEHDLDQTIPQQSKDSQDLMASQVYSEPYSTCTSLYNQDITHLQDRRNTGLTLLTSTEASILPDIGSTGNITEDPGCSQSALDTGIDPSTYNGNTNVSKCYDNTSNFQGSNSNTGVCYEASQGRHNIGKHIDNVSHYCDRLIPIYDVIVTFPNM